MHPSLYQINTRILLSETGARLGRAATLDDVADEELDRLAEQGFDFVWLTGVWQTGAAGREISRTKPEWREAYREVLPDVTDADICGSPFAVRRYSAHEDFGGDEALRRLRDRLRWRGLRLMLDFVPNHVALDHPWVYEHPEYFVVGGEQDLRNEPRNYVRVAVPGGVRVLAHGRDPFFPGWSDTLQLNYRHAALREAMIGELMHVSRFCDAVRCDMAMLVLPQVFRRTWGDRALPSDGSPPADAPFWPEAVRRIKGQTSEFTLLAEAYWDLEATLQTQGFDYTYDKSYYDRLCAADATAVRRHLQADPEFQRRCARFLENHDEPRAATVFEPAMHQAAALLAYTVPGMRLFHDGQLEGRRERTNIHLSRRTAEAPDPVLRDYYGRLLACLRRPEMRDGKWRLLERRPAWPENPTWQNFIAYEWRARNGHRLWICVNYGATFGQCYVEPRDEGLRERSWHLRDQLSRAWYERDGNELAERGLYLDMPPWGCHVFDVAAS